MGRIIAGIGSSHAFALVDPARWDEMREQNRSFYSRRYGSSPPVQPQVAQETDEDIERRYARIREAHALIRRRLEELDPGVLILIGDDQNEHFTRATVLPQVAVYQGGDFQVVERGQAEGVVYRSAPGLAETLVSECIDAEIDVTAIGAFSEDRLIAHAFGPLLRVFDPQARIPVIPVFVNAIHFPAPSPARCYYLGQAIRRAVDRHPDPVRVIVCGSGGLSHFTAGYPWDHYEGPFSYGAISTDFDRWVLARMQAGEGEALAALTSQELLANGDIELRSWITMLGAIGDAQPELLIYEPFYRAIMGVGVGYWPVAG